MKILFAGTEMFPWLKVGGLGDVIGSLPPALRERGVDVRVLVPGFAAVLAAAGDAVAVLELDDFYGGRAVVRAASGPHGVPVYVLDAAHLFGGLKDPYAFDESTHLRFAAFSFLASHVARFGLDDGFRPDVLHVHDWQCGLAPVWIAHAPAHERRPTVLTIHNVSYQGNFPASVLAEIGLPAGSFSMNGVEFHGQVGFLKGGLAYATKITTVSPTYADEICRSKTGFGLDGLLTHRRADLVGILNGIDVVHWDPSREGAIDTPFDIQTLGRREAARRALLARVGLPSRDGAPLFGVVSRIVAEKGLDWVVEVVPRLRALGAQLVVLGRGDPEIEASIAAARDANPETVAFVAAYDEALAMRIFAGIDVLLVPSRYEPCGLTQMYAMRFGALPLVRRTGGLADTVVDADEPPPAEPTGFVFDEASADALASSIERVCACFREERERWSRMQRTGMQRDFSWSRSSAEYVALYRSLTAR